METAKIAEYYDVTLGSYQKHWYKSSNSYSLHYGLWEQDTKTLHEAFINTNKFMAETGNIKAYDVVLDAGCGVGGSSIWLAKNIGCKVIGITLSQKQQQEATKLAKENGVEKLTEFYRKDFTNTGFADSSFDVVWGLESVCHANVKLEFLKEAYRLLKNDGRVLVCDGFRKRQPQTPEEEINLHKFEEGLALPATSLIPEFHKDLEIAGFQNINFWDKTEQVTPSSQKLYNMCRFTYPLLKLVKLLKKNSKTLQVLDKNAGAGVAQYKLLKVGIAGYGLFYAEK
ncbi:class I SAM-dependent methyltransferase [Ancylothrix sp. C2]|uniref:SAM-dependent methyltransferase n=1 Tax=Ancylothrix sp. D3o TaxID=2953691 RepID=UPI0021BB80E1|nr:methyltransferase domain-containing protein [Ancylothrix sp. D3o]MCT7950613.1 class I SAM-dependent methyltransferase [Ancylothrix sp. D3o]